VNVVARTPDDRLVLVRQFRFGSNELSLEVPGGDGGGRGSRRGGPEGALGGDRLRRRRRASWGACTPTPRSMDNRCHFVLVDGAVPTGPMNWDDDEEIEVSTAPRRGGARLGPLGADHAQPLGGGAHALRGGPARLTWRPPGHLRRHPAVTQAHPRHERLPLRQQPRRPRRPARGTAAAAWRRRSAGSTRAAPSTAGGSRSTSSPCAGPATARSRPSRSARSSSGATRRSSPTTARSSAGWPRSASSTRTPRGRPRRR
jgi:hypothetical protein